MAEHRRNNGNENTNTQLLNHSDQPIERDWLLPYVREHTQLHGPRPILILM